MGDGKIKKREFEYYYNLHYHKAYAYVIKRIFNPQDSEDIVMECFESCYKNFEKFDPNKASFGTWFFVILNNRLKNYYRDHKMMSELSDDIKYDFSFENEFEEAERIKKSRDDLANALQLLNDTQKKIVIMKYYHNKNSAEIALELGLTPTNVRVTLSRSLDKMKKYYDDNNIVLEC